VSVSIEHRGTVLTDGGATPMSAILIDPARRELSCQPAVRRLRIEAEIEEQVRLRKAAQERRRMAREGH
jgi:hypothetical protein